MKEHSVGTKVLNVSIRAATLAARFLFIFFLAKFLTPSEVGLYGLVVATIMYSLYFVGLDFYTYTTREFARSDRSVWGSLIKNQMALSLGMYCIVLPALLMVFVFGLLPWSLAKWFFLLIIVEHVCQELIRLFVAVSEQVAASVVLFLRQGSWAIVVIGVMLVQDESRNLDVVFGSWLVACIFAIGFSLQKLHKMGLGGWALPVNRKWIWRGIKIALPFLVATLAIRGVFTVDRYWVQFLVGLEVVGAYVLFIGVANTLMALLDAAVFSFAYPQMINAYHNHDSDIFRRKMREMVVLTVVFSAGFAAISSLLLPYLLHWIDRPVYLENYMLFYWLLLATILNALSMIPHYGVYAQKRDRSIIYSHLAALPIFLLATGIVSVWTPIYAVPIGLCVSQFVILVWKFSAYTQSTPSNFKAFRKA